MTDEEATELLIKELIKERSISAADAIHLMIAALVDAGADPEAALETYREWFAIRNAEVT